ncbi:hypothetical protein SDRG_09885 [Saprolegnia diclina VS20]|uniref:Uncharacterized protein n=1 Tax=Saprolegnia diclina (strain VS20) TaxID=1156394 RepID=T0QCY2_SAPDV|nr:hypothetical protein SDRG_09885 [Saprolegnia diclina VS20]EQC32566.1 hypothetical protein SDRG_09885 [Saprolegnia diclina VS20]|eukprot:XP_008614067.1 hypothetical protein SDRG_09885 [Saprolegnia diclina VS20]
MCEPVEFLEDAFLAALTDGMVHNGLLLGETWEALCGRKYKPPPTGTAVLVTSRSRDLTDAEVQIAAKLYQDRVQFQPDLDLDDIMQQVLDQREVNHMKWDFERAQKIAAYLPRLERQVTVLVKTKAGSVKELSPMQFAAHFGELHVVLALLAVNSIDAEDAFFEACREGYVSVVTALLSASNVTWGEHSVGHGFVLATRRNHLLVLQALVASPSLRLDVLCHGPWFQDQALGQRGC